MRLRHLSLSIVAVWGCRPGKCQGVSCLVRRKHGRLKAETLECRHGCWSKSVPPNQPLGFAAVEETCRLRELLSNALHSVSVRLARWLLMCQDRIGSAISLTHHDIALMPGVRRSSVTDGLHILETDRPWWNLPMTLTANLKKGINCCSKKPFRQCRIKVRSAGSPRDLSSASRFCRSRQAI